MGVLNERHLNTGHEQSKFFALVDLGNCYFSSADTGLFFSNLRTKSLAALGKCFSYIGEIEKEEKGEMK